MTDTKNSFFDSKMVLNQYQNDDQMVLKKEIRNLLKTCFEAFDSNHSGSMDFKEFWKVIKIMGVKMNKAQIKQIFEEFDEDESGTIEYHEFLNLMANFFVSLLAHSCLHEGITHQFFRIHSESWRR